MGVWAKAAWCATRRIAARRSSPWGRARWTLGAAVLGYHSSGLPGPKGNRETFIHLRDPAKAAGTVLQEGAPEDGQRAVGAGAHGRDDLERMARVVEP